MATPSKTNNDTTKLIKPMTHELLTSLKWISIASIRSQIAIDRISRQIEESRKYQQELAKLLADGKGRNGYQKLPDEGTVGISNELREAGRY